VLASSSSGNCLFLSTARTRILVDAGLSGKETSKRLAEIGEDASRLDAIIVTHEHSDHVAGLPRLAKTLRVPVFGTCLTAPALVWEDFTPALETFQAGTRIAIGDIEIDSFTIPHDAADPVGYRIQAEGIKVGVVTDLGYIPDSIKMHLRGIHFLLLESNHDLEMLKVGPYPWSVKQRVMGRKGHLSNRVVEDFMRNDLDSSVHTVVLGHLSEHNNHPALVRMMADQALSHRAVYTRAVIAEPRKASEVFMY
jgi:phosphoribosyl 1,2-cyclic phosphodiesterase